MPDFDIKNANECVALLDDPHEAGKLRLELIKTQKNQLMKIALHTPSIIRIIWVELRACQQVI